MDLPQALAAMLRDEPGAAEVVRAQPAAAWIEHAPALVELISEVPRDWKSRWLLQRALANPGATDLVRLMLEPGSERVGLAVGLAQLIGPNEVIEARLAELPDSDEVKRARSEASGEAAVEDLAHWMGKPFTSGEVVESISATLPKLSRLSPVQLGKRAPRLIELLQNWFSVTGGDDWSDALYDELERADLPTLIKTTDAWLTSLADRREAWIRIIDDLSFRSPRSRWARELLEYLRPSADEAIEEEPLADEPPVQVETFRRR